MEADEDGQFIEKDLIVPVPEGQIGRKLHASIPFHNEDDTNACILHEDGAIVYWSDTGADLTADELNTVIRTPDTTLWEWIMENLDVKN